MVAAILIATASLPYSVISSESGLDDDTVTSENSTRIKQAILEGLHDELKTEPSKEERVEETTTSTTAFDATEGTFHQQQDEQGDKIGQDIEEDESNTKEEHHTVPVVTQHSEAELDSYTSTVPLDRGSNPGHLDIAVLTVSDCEDGLQDANIGEQDVDQKENTGNVGSIKEAEEYHLYVSDASNVGSSVSDKSTEDEVTNHEAAESVHARKTDVQLGLEDVEPKRGQGETSNSDPHHNVHIHQSTDSDSDGPKETESNKEVIQSSASDTSSTTLSELADSSPHLKERESNNEGPGSDPAPFLRETIHESRHSDDGSASTPDEANCTSEQLEKPISDTNVYVDVNGDVVVDLDANEEQVKLSATSKKEKAPTRDDVGVNGEILTHTSQEEDTEEAVFSDESDKMEQEKGKNDDKPAPKGSLADFFEKATSKTSAKNSFKQELEMQEKVSSYYTSPSNTNAPNEKLYQGEPWGYFRPTRRLPDLQLLFMLFHDMHNGPRPGPSEVKLMMEELQNNPLFDADLVNELKGNIESGLNIFDGKDNFEGKSESTDLENTTQDSEPASPTKSSDVNSDFVEGLDDIDKFFEGVDPPDELDVGASGTSIQEVLMGKGKQILVKKILQLSHGIRSGWKKVCSSVGNVFSRGDDNGINTSTVSEENFKIQDLPKTVWEVGKRSAERLLNFMDVVIDHVENFFEKDHIDDSDILDFSSAVE
jgi:hypothetical protein